MVEIDYTAELKGSLKLSKSGEWWHEGKPFERQSLSKLFSRSIVWDEGEQQYFVQLGRQRARFDLEDTAYFVEELLDNNSPWQIKLSDDSIEAFDPKSLRIGSEDQLYCSVKGSHRARFSRAAHQTLLRYVVDDRALMIDGVRWELKKIAR